MKLWLKYLIAVCVGLLFGIFLPLYGGDTVRVFEQIFTYVIHVGRYIVFPLLFFSIVIGTFELWAEKNFVRVYGLMFAYSFVSAIILATLGTAVIVMIFPGPVPIIIEEAEIYLPPDLNDQFFRIAPTNLFSIFTESGDFLLPLIVFSVAFGIALFHKRTFSEPLTETFESISHILYGINRFILEILSFGIFLMSAYRIVQLKGIADFELFSRFLLIILGTTLLIIFVIIPGLLYVLGNKRHNPFIWLFATLPAAISAVFSGDNYFTIGSTIVVLNENMGLEKKITPSITALAAIFSRSGIAMITSMSFILILRSYSSLEITFLQYIWVIGTSVLISFMLGATPSNGIMVSLAIISAWNVQGLEESFLILLPIAPVLASLSVLIDTIVILFNCQLIMYRETKTMPGKLSDFQ